MQFLQVSETVLYTAAYAAIHARYAVEIHNETEVLINGVWFTEAWVSGPEAAKFVAEVEALI